MKMFLIVAVGVFSCFVDALFRSFEADKKKLK